MMFEDDDGEDVMGGTNVMQTGGIIAEAKQRTCSRHQEKQTGKEATTEGGSELI